MKRKVRQMSACRRWASTALVPHDCEVSLAARLGYMASTILGIAHFTFHDGQVEEFLRLSDRCRDIVAAQDTGTLRYDIYLNEDRTKAVVIEEYRDEQALQEHGEHLGKELSESVLATAEVHGELLGDLTDDLRSQLRGGPVEPFVGPVARR